MEVLVESIDVTAFTVHGKGSGIAALLRLYYCSHESKNQWI